MRRVTKHQRSVVIRKTMGEENTYRTVGLYVGAAVGVRDGPVGCLVGDGLGFETRRERC